MPTEIETAPAVDATAEANKPAKKGRATKVHAANEASDAAQALSGVSVRATALVRRTDYIERNWTKPVTFAAVKFIGAGVTREELLKEVPVLKKAPAGLKFFFLKGEVEVAYSVNDNMNAVINPAVAAPNDRVTFLTLKGAVQAPAVEAPVEAPAETVTEQPEGSVETERSFVEDLEIASPPTIPAAERTEEQAPEAPVEPADSHAGESPKKRARRLAHEAAEAKAREEADFAAAQGE